MQIIVNCFAMMRGGIVMLQKPRRGWWVLPGGKVNPDESWPEAARREMLEETGLHVHQLELRGIHHLSRLTGESNELSRMLIAQFVANRVEGTLLESCKEGTLGLIQPSALADLPMDPGDRIMVTHTCRGVETNSRNLLFGKFTYTEAYDLTEWTMEPDSLPDLNGV